MRSSIDRAVDMDRGTSAVIQEWSLKLGATAIALAVFAGSVRYAAANVWNAGAPLHPTIDAQHGATAPAAHAPGLALPFLSFGPALHATPEPPITRSHTS